jgi:hypothetical protein
LSLSLEEIESEINKFDKDSKALKKHIFKLCWYMRGSIGVDEMFQLSYSDRDLLNKIVEENIEVTNKTKLPFF